MENTNEPGQKLPLLTPKNPDGPQRVIKRIMVIDPNKLRISGLDLKMAEALKKSKKQSPNVSKVDPSKHDKLALAKSLLNRKIKQAQMSKVVSKQETPPQQSLGKPAEDVTKKISLPTNDTSLASLMPPPISPVVHSSNKSCTLLLNFLKSDQKSGSFEVNLLNPTIGSQKKMQPEQKPKASLGRSKPIKGRAFESKVISPGVKFEMTKRSEPETTAYEPAPIAQYMRNVCSDGKSISDKIRECLEAQRMSSSHYKQKPKVIENKILSPDEKIDLNTLYVKSQVKIIPDAAPLVISEEEEAFSNRSECNENMFSTSTNLTEPTCLQEELQPPEVTQNEVGCAPNVEESAIDFINNLSFMFDAQPKSEPTFNSFTKEEIPNEEDATSFLKAFLQQQQQSKIDLRQACTSTTQMIKIEEEPHDVSQENDKITEYIIYDNDRFNESTKSHDINKFIEPIATESNVPPTEKREAVKIKSEPDIDVPQEGKEIEKHFISEKDSVEDLSKSSKPNLIKKVDVLHAANRLVSVENQISSQHSCTSAHKTIQVEAEPSDVPKQCLQIKDNISVKNILTEELINPTKPYQISKIKVQIIKESHKSPSTTDAVIEAHITSSNVQSPEQDTIQRNSTASDSLKGQCSTVDKASLLSENHAVIASPKKIEVVAYETVPTRDLPTSDDITKLQLQVSAVKSNLTSPKKPQDISLPSHLKGGEVSSTTPSASNTRRKGKKSVPVLIAKLNRSRKTPTATPEASKTELISDSLEKPVVFEKAKSDLPPPVGSCSNPNTDSSEIENNTTLFKETSSEKLLKHVKDVLTDKEISIDILTSQQQFANEKSAKSSNKSDEQHAQRISKDALENKTTVALSLSESQKTQNSSDDNNQGTEGDNRKAGDTQKKINSSLEQNFVTMQSSNSIPIPQGSAIKEVGENLENATEREKVRQSTETEGQTISEKSENLGPNETTTVENPEPSKCSKATEELTTIVLNPQSATVTDLKTQELKTVEIFSKRVIEDLESTTRTDKAEERTRIEILKISEVSKKLDLKELTTSENPAPTKSCSKIIEDVRELKILHPDDSLLPPITSVPDSKKQKIKTFEALIEDKTSAPSSRGKKPGKVSQLEECTALRDSNYPTLSPIKKRLKDENKSGSPTTLNAKTLPQHEKEGRIITKLSTEGTTAELNTVQLSGSSFLEICTAVNPEEDDTLGLKNKEPKSKRKSKSVEKLNPSLSLPSTSKSTRYINMKTEEISEENLVISDTLAASLIANVPPFEEITPRSRKKTAKFEEYSKSSVKNLKKMTSLKDSESSKGDSLISPLISVESPQVVKAGRKKTKIETKCKLSQESFPIRVTETEKSAEMSLDASYLSETPKGDQSLISPLISAQSPHVAKAGRKKAKTETKLPQESLSLNVLETKQNDEKHANASHQSETPKSDQSLISHLTFVESPQVAKVGRKKTKLETKRKLSQETFPIGVTETEQSTEMSLDPSFLSETPKGDQSLISPLISAQSSQVAKAGRKKAKTATKGKLPQESFPLGVTETKQSAEMSLDASYLSETPKCDQSLISPLISAQSPQVAKAGRKKAKTATKGKLPQESFPLGVTETEQSAEMSLDASYLSETTKGDQSLISPLISAQTPHVAKAGRKKAKTETKLPQESLSLNVLETKQNDERHPNACHQSETPKSDQSLISHLTFVESPQVAKVGRKKTKLETKRKLLQETFPIGVTETEQSAEMSLDASFLSGTPKGDQSLISPLISAQSSQVAKAGRKKAKTTTKCKLPQESFPLGVTKTEQSAEMSLNASYLSEAPPLISAQSPQVAKAGRKKAKTETKCKLPQESLSVNVLETKQSTENPADACHQSETPKSDQSLISQLTFVESPQVTKVGRKKPKLENKCKLSQEALSLGVSETEQSFEKALHASDLPETPKVDQSLIPPLISVESPQVLKVGRKKTKPETKCKLPQESLSLIVSETKQSDDKPVDICYQSESPKGDQSLSSPLISVELAEFAKVGRKKGKLGTEFKQSQDSLTVPKDQQNSEKPVEASQQHCDGTQHVAATLEPLESVSNLIEEVGAAATKETTKNETPMSTKPQNTPKQRKSEFPIRKVKFCEKADPEVNELPQQNSIADSGSNDSNDFLGFNEKEIEEGQQSTSLRLSQSDGVEPVQLQSPPTANSGKKKESTRAKKSSLQRKGKQKMDQMNCSKTLSASLKNWLVTSDRKEDTQPDTEKIQVQTKKNKILAPPKKRRDNYQNLTQDHSADQENSSVLAKIQDGTPGNVNSTPEPKTSSEEKACTGTQRQRGRIKVKNLEQINNSIDQPKSKTDPDNSTDDITTTIEKINSKRGRRKRKKSDDEDAGETQEPPAKIPHLSADIGSDSPLPLKKTPNRIPSLHLGTSRYIFANPLEKKYKNDTEFNPRLLLIRQKDELKSDAPLIDPDMQTEATSKEDVQCALCMGFTPQKMWLQHLSGHYGVGWITGSPQPLNLKSRSSVLSCMIDFFKVSKVKGLNCRLCQVQRRSALGLLTHLEQCCLTEDELRESRVNCEHCHNNYSKNTLPVHLRSCPALQIAKSTDEEQEKVSDSNTKDAVLSNTGRLKRKSVIKAENKFKDMDNNEFIPDEFIKYIPQQNKDSSVWLSEIQKFGKGFCAQKKCSFTATNVEELIEHSHDGVCNFYRKSGYYCMKCNLYDITIEPVRLHVLDTHKPKSQKDFEDSGDDASVGSESSSGMESSGDEEGTGDGSVANEDGSRDRSRHNRKKGEKTKRKRSWGKKQKSNITEVVKKLFPDRSPAIVYIVEKWFDNFIKTNYSTDALFTFALPSKSHADGQDFESYFPTSSISINFIQNGFKGYVKELGTTVVEPDQWRNLERLKGVGSSNEHLMYLGGPISCMSWLPLEPHSASPIQYLAVSCRKAVDKYSRFVQPKSSRSLVYIQKYDISNSLELRGELLYAIAIEKGPIHCIEFLPSGGYSPEKNRLGLLAVGTINTEINVYSLPIEVEKDNCDTLCVSLEPSFVLCLESTVLRKEYSDVYQSQCTTLIWSQTIGHNYIVGSYLNGFIAIWDISDDEDNLNRFVVNGLRTFVPVSYFWAMDNKLKIAAHYDMDGLRWLAVCNSSRKLHIYDLREITKPTLVYADTTKNVSNRIYWPTVWENPCCGLGNEMASYGCCINTISPMNLGYNSRKLDRFCSGVNDIDFSAWYNIYAAGAENGDVHVFEVKEAVLDVANRGKLDSKLITTLDVVSLNGTPMTQGKLPNISKWSDANYKENYGIVFGSLKSIQATNNPGLYNFSRIPPLNLCRLMRVNRVQFNPNKNAKNFLAIGYNNGFLRVLKNNWHRTTKEH